jgi:ADP-ribose pyrophosphatase
MVDKIKKWKLVKSEKILDEYMSIAKRRYLLPSGKEKDFYIDLHGKSVIVLPITKDNQIVLVRQYRPGPDEILTELPAGRVEKGEDVLEAAERELLEETGYKGEAKFIVKAPTGAYSTKWRHTVLVTNCEKISDQKTDDSEFIEVVLMSMDELRGHVRTGKLTSPESVYLGLDYLGLL